MSKTEKKVININKNNSARRLIFFVIVISFFYFIIFGKDGILSVYRLSRSQKQLKNKIEVLKIEIDSLKNEVEEFRNNDSKIEKVAREKFGMAGKNETIYKFTKDKD